MNSKRILRALMVTVATLCVGSMAAMAQGTIQVEGGDTYDWGTVAPAKLKAAIKVMNVGTDTLKINEVRPACGCTVAPIDKNVLAPNDIATIDVTLDVSSRTGPVEKSITIASSDRDTPYYVLHLKAIIRRPLTLVPTNYFVVSNGEKGVPTEASVIRIMNSSDQAVTIQPPQLSSGNVKVEFADIDGPREINPGETLELKATVTPLDEKYVFGELTVATTSAEMPQINLSITGNMKQPPPGATSNAPGNQ